MEDLFLDTIEVNNLKVATKLIKESIADYSKLFHSSPAGMTITGIEKGTFVKVNEKFLEIFGYRKEEIIGRTPVEVGIIDEMEFNKILNIRKEKGKLQNDTIKCHTKDGKIVYAIASTEVMEINGKEYSVSSFLNITKIKEQKSIIKQQHKDIVDSINYARLIQNAIFPSQKQIEEILPESFVLAKAKHIVSGDFYWIKKHENKIFVSACDCTGHGVPGAFISIIGYKLLSKFIIEYGFSNPAEILNQLNKEFSTVDKQVIDKLLEIKDGMDIALCVIDKSKMTMEYAGAYNPVYLVRKGAFTKLSVDKIPIHLFTSHTGRKFTNHKIRIEVGDTFYLFSDGYTDQFGGPRGKKFMHKNFQELILSIQRLTMPEQKEVFDKTIEKWQRASGEEQTDDILILGFKV